jgi:hypothetical protein
MSSTNYADYSTGTGFIGWYIAATRMSHIIVITYGKIRDLLTNLYVAAEPIACTSNGAWTTSGTIGDCSESSGDRIATACYAGSSVVRGSTTEAWCVFHHKLYRSLANWSLAVLAQRATTTESLILLAKMVWVP